MAKFRPRKATGPAHLNVTLCTRFAWPDREISAVMGGLEVGWLAVRAAPEWSLWAPARSVSPFEDDVESPVTGQMAKCRSVRARRPRGDHAGVARCSAIELPPSTTRYCPVM